MSEVTTVDVMTGEVRSRTLTDDEIANRPTVVATPVRERIDALERQHLAPRFLREYLLTDIEQRAAAADQNPMQLPAYVKLKALDTQIAALRSQL